MGKIKLSATIWAATEDDIHNASCISINEATLESVNDPTICATLSSTDTTVRNISWNATCAAAVDTINGGTVWIK